MVAICYEPIMSRFPPFKGVYGLRCLRTLGVAVTSGTARGSFCLDRWRKVPMGSGREFCWWSNVVVMPVKDFLTQWFQFGMRRNKKNLIFQSFQSGEETVLECKMFSNYKIQHIEIYRMISIYLNCMILYYYSNTYGVSHSIQWIYPSYRLTDLN